MLSRKRQASESILPTRDAKLPRTNPQGPRKQQGVLQGFSSVTGFIQGLFERGPSTQPSNNRVTYHHPPPSKSNREPRLQLPARRHIPSLLLSSEIPNGVTKSDDLTVMTRSLPNESSLHAAMSRREMPPLPSARVLAPSASVTSIASIPGPSRQADAAELLSQSDSQPPSSQGSHRSYRTREHIHARQHKERIIRDRKKELDELMQELYILDRKKGYKANFETFKGFMEYKYKLQTQTDDGSVLHSQPSRTGIHERRHSSPETSTDAFLRKALARARNTLREPQQTAFQTPLYDRSRIAAQAKDAEIDGRLHPKVSIPSSLPPQDESQVDGFLQQRGVLSKLDREQVVDKDIARLRPNQWLNDEIINFYGALIQARSQEKENIGATNGVTKASSKRQPLNVHYFNTFFWTKLKSDGYEKGRLQKWTKKFDIFSKDVILIPVNHDNTHWTAAAINFRCKRIESYDSMNMERSKVFKILRNYLDAEHRNKRKQTFDFSDWEDYTLESTPQQENGFDCGVFTCQFLESLSRGEEAFSFSQENMPYLRRRMIWEICNRRLRDD